MTHAEEMVAKRVGFEIRYSPEMGGWTRRYVEGLPGAQVEFAFTRELVLWHEAVRLQERVDELEKTEGER